MANIKVPRRIYYYTDTGEVLWIRGQAQGDAIDWTPEWELANIPELQGVDMDRLKWTTLKYNQYAVDFEMYRKVSVDVNYVKLVFSEPRIRG